MMVIKLMTLTKYISHNLYFSAATFYIKGFDDIIVFYE